MPADKYKLFTKHDKKAIKLTDTVSATTYSYKDQILEIILVPALPNTCVFGVPLVELVKRELSNNNSNSIANIPILMSMCLTFVNKYALEEVGLFRLSGSNNKIRELAKQFNSGSYAPLKPATDPHVVTGLVKKFLREMPEPLLTFDLYESFRMTMLKVKGTFCNIFV